MTVGLYFIIHLACIVPAYVVERLSRKVFSTPDEKWTKKDQAGALAWAIVGSWGRICFLLFIFAFACIIYLLIFVLMFGEFIVFLYRCLFKDGISFSSVKWDEEVNW